MHVLFYVHDLDGIMFFFMFYFILKKITFNTLCCIIYHYYNYDLEYNPTLLLEIITWEIELYIYQYFTLSGLTFTLAS